MNHRSIPQFIQKADVILGEGAVIERIKRDSAHELDPYIVNAAFIYEDQQRSLLADIYKAYLDIGCATGLPLLLSAPTWRASQERIQSAGYTNRDVNADNFNFLNDLRKSYGAYAEKVIICGLMSCRGDAYKPAERLSEKEARQFHSWQAGKLAKAGVDFLLAATLPALSEALGLAAAQAATGKPYIISFVLRPQGTLLDNTPLKEAITTIDAKVHPKPLAYLANCTHASFFRSAVSHEQNASPQIRKRIMGLLANTAALEPEALDNNENLIGEKPEAFGRDMAKLKDEYGLKLLGGCCGTDERHIQALADNLIHQF
jgi:S-methylmethionine-dependent homocysteine/selenocysteine methylase